MKHGFMTSCVLWQIKLPFAFHMVFSNGKLTRHGYFLEQTYIFIAKANASRQKKSLWFWIVKVYDITFLYMRLDWKISSFAFVEPLQISMDILYLHEVSKLLRSIVTNCI